MDKEAFDKLVDDATHAVLALIPANTLSAAQLEDLTDEVNDYLSDALSVLKGA